MVLTVGFVVWGIYLARKLTQVNGLGSTFRYAIATGSILWLPIEAFSRWGLYPEIWIKPAEYTFSLIAMLLLFTAVVATLYRNEAGPAEVRTA